MLFITYCNNIILNFIIYIYIFRRDKDHDFEKKTE